MTAPLRIELLASAHPRDGFRCGQVALDRYLATQALQDMRRRVSACFVAIEPGTGVIAGFYTLAAAAVRLGDLPEAQARRLPRYPDVPVARLGRLAVATAFQGRQLGAALLADAALRAARSEVAVHALLVDAKDEPAAAFYRHHGFLPLSDEGRALVLPLAGWLSRR